MFFVEPAVEPPISSALDPFSATFQENNVLFKNHTARAASIFMLCLVLAACGSSSDGLATLTSSNAQLAASDVSGTVDFLGGIESLVDDYDGMIEQQGELQITENCTAGFFTVDIQDGGTPGVTDTGDTFRIDFNNCTIENEDGTLTLNGGMLFSAEEISGSLDSAFTRRIRVDFIGLTVNAGVIAMVLNGDVTHDLSSTDGVVLNSVISGSNLAAFAQVAFVGWSGTLSNYSLERMYDTSDDSFSVSIDATYDSSRLGGAVHFETTAPFTGNGDENPSAGTMVVTGAEGATLTLVAIDSVNVTLYLDVDADGEDDVTIETDWDTLDGQDS